MVVDRSDAVRVDVYPPVSVVDDGVIGPTSL
jgi:hypothetical protein